MAAYAGQVRAEVWQERARAHAERADALTAGHRARKAAGQRHAVEDFLFEYYSTRPSLLRRWHPGAGAVLEPGDRGPAPHAGWRWYTTDRDDGSVRLDAGAFLDDRGETVAFVHRLLTATASRPAFTGCFGLHEWAMVYRAGADRRHPLPLRLGPGGTAARVAAPGPGGPRRRRRGPSGPLHALRRLPVLHPGRRPAQPAPADPRHPGGA